MDKKINENNKSRRGFGSFLFHFVHKNKGNNLMNKTYRSTVQEDAEGNAFIEIPEEILTHLGWKEGDELVWEVTEVCDDDGESKGAVIYKNKA